MLRKKAVTPDLLGGETAPGLHRSLTRMDLLVIGVAEIIGAGIFVIAGQGIKIAGPGIILSFLLAGFACTLAALCYAELASLIPEAGSAYSYSYAVFGEIFAWIIGWDLLLEYGMGGATVASGWSAYFQEFIGAYGLQVPRWASGPYNPAAGQYFNLPAALIVLFFAGLLVFHTRLNALVARGLVVVKLGVILFILALGAWLVSPQNWLPLMPHGWESVTRAASLVFFAFLGFDVVSVTAEEAQNPARDVPFGIIGSLALCSLIYLLAALVLVGMMPWREVDPGAPFSAAFRHFGYIWAADFIALGALVGMTSVFYMLLMAQPRILFAMARDGLLPRSLAALHPRYRTPHRLTLGCALVVALLSGFTPIDRLAYMCNVGTLFAFFLVCLGVLILRFTQPHLPRPFRCPLGKTVAALGALVSLGLMFSMPALAWQRLGLWLVGGLLIYFLWALLSWRRALPENASFQ